MKYAKIVKCSEHLWWYKGHIGNEYPLVEPSEFKNGLTVLLPNTGMDGNLKCWVSFNDAVVFEK